MSEPEVDHTQVTKDAHDKDIQRVAGRDSEVADTITGAGLVCM